MPVSRIALIEHLGACGAAASDARARASLLQDAGFSVQPLIADPALCGVSEPPERPGLQAPRFGMDRAGRAALRERVTALAPDLALVASASAGGGALAGLLPGSLAARWWPVAVASIGPAHRRDLPPLGSAGDGLSWTAGDPARRARARLPLWDGDYVLAPLALEGRAGHEALAAFAEAAEYEEALDFVVLADPQPEFESAARRLGVGFRVHFAGTAPREAEYAWWSAAAAAVFAAESGFAAGLVWRGLECGCPLMVAGDGALSSALGAWLAGHGCLAGPRAGGAPALAEAVAEALARAPEPLRAAERGRALAREQAAMLPARLAAALLGGGARRAA